MKIQGQNEEMLLTACEQFLGKPKQEIQEIALHTLEGHQRAIMGSMTVEVWYIKLYLILIIIYFLFFIRKFIKIVKNLVNKFLK